MSESAKELVKFGNLWVAEFIEELRRDDQAAAMKNRKSELQKWEEFASK